MTAVDLDSFDDEYDDEATEDTPAASSSLLAGLRGRREQALQHLHFDYPVPKMEPLHVRYRPCTADEVEAAHKLAKKNKHRGDGDLIGQASVLVKCCLGIFDTSPAGDPVQDPDDWLTFGPELADALGMDVHNPRAIDVVRKLYVREGDITSAFSQLVVDSGWKLEELEETLTGN